METGFDFGPFDFDTFRDADNKREDLSWETIAVNSSAVLCVVLFSSTVFLAILLHALLSRKHRRNDMEMVEKEISDDEWWTSGNYQEQGTEEPLENAENQEENFQQNLENVFEPEVQVNE